MRVVVIATGGTITSHFDGGEWLSISLRQLIDELGDGYSDVDVVDAAAGPSSNLNVDDMVAVAAHVSSAFDRGATGVVVVHGTDTMELTAYLTHLLDPAAGRGPVVFTGSMRVHSHPQPDGPQNLRDAIATARSWRRATSGVLVCMEGVLHTAPFVGKRSAASVDAFDSFPYEPVGRVLPSGNTIDGGGVPPRGLPVSVLADEVPLISCYPGIDAAVFERAAIGARGMVIEGFGDLNIPDAAWGPVHDAWQRGLLVVLASRVFTPTSSNEAMEFLGGVGAGGLTAQKARLLAMAALGSTADRDAAATLFRSHALPHHHGERSSG